MVKLFFPQINCLWLGYETHSGFTTMLGNLMIPFLIFISWPCMLKNIYRNLVWVFLVINFSNYRYLLEKIMHACYAAYIFTVANNNDRFWAGIKIVC